MGPAIQVLLADAVRRAIEREPTEPFITERIEGRLGRYRTIDLTAPEVRDLPQAKAARIGLHPFQTLLYRHGGALDRALADGASLADWPATDWELVAWLETLGELALATVHLKLPAPIAELRARWKAIGADPAQQIEICDALLRLLVEPPRTASVDSGADRPPLDPTELWLTDYVDQGPERIIPRLFLLEGGRPNCLGKGIILTSFFWSLGVKVLGATPIAAFYEVAEDTLLMLAGLIGDTAAKRGVKLRDRLQKAFDQRALLAEARKSTPDRFHMAVIVPLADGRSYLIDPHQMCGGVMGETDEIAYVASLVDEFCPVLPGVALLHSEGRGAHALRLDAARAAEQVLDPAYRMLHRWTTQYSRNPAAVIPLLAMNRRLLEALLDMGICSPPEKAKEFLATLRGEGDARFVILTFEQQGVRQALRFRTNSGREPGMEELTLYYLAVTVLDAAAGGRLLPAMVAASDPSREQRPPEADGIDSVSEILVSAMDEVLSILQSIGYREAIKKLGYGRETLGGIHPLVEAYEPIFRIGVEIIAHLNAIGDCSDDVVRELAALCGGQHHVTLAATEPLRTGDKTLSPLARSAVDLLRATPARIKAAEEGLLQLEERGLTTPSAKTEGEPDEPEEEEPRAQPEGLSSADDAARSDAGHAEPCPAG